MRSIALAGLLVCALLVGGCGARDDDEPPTTAPDRAACDLDRSDELREACRALGTT